MPRPRSDSFRVILCPSVAAVLSLSTKASISCSNRGATPRPCAQSSPPRSLKQCPVSAISITSRADDDSDDEADSEPRPRRSPAIRSRNSAIADATAPPSSQQPCIPVPLPSKPSPPTCLLQASNVRTALLPHAPKQPSPLRRIASKPMYPSALYSTQSAQLPLYAVPAPPTQEEPRLYPSARPTIPLYKQALRRAFFAGPSGCSAKKFGVRGAWEVERDIQRAIAGGYAVHMEDISGAINRPRTTTRTCIRNTTVVALVKSDEEEEVTSSGSDGTDDYTPSGFYSSEEEEESESLLLSWEFVSL